MKTRYRVERINRFKQCLKKEYLFWKFTIWSKVIDTEIIPEHVCISLACFGDTSGWVSKFAPFNKNGEKL